MSARAIDLELRPSEHNAGSASLQISTYTYDAAKVAHDVMAERVALDFDSTCIRAMTRLTPDEARVLANQLLQVADQADEARERRESFEQISDEMLSARFTGGSTGVLYAHPDVHYVASDQLAAKCAELKASGARRWMVLANTVDERIEVAA